MKLNIANILYLFFRLAPFIIVCYFTVQSIFNQDLKGLIYLIGLLVACTSSMMIGNTFTPHPQSSDIAANAKCNLLTLGENGAISNFPLSQTVLGYTLAYLSYFIGIYKLETQNIATFIFFPILVIADMIWNTINNCSSGEYMLASLIIGGIIGAFWAMIIDSTQMSNLTYFSGISNNEVCSVPSKGLYKCKSVKKKPNV